MLVVFLWTQKHWCWCLAALRDEICRRPVNSVDIARTGPERESNNERLFRLSPWDGVLARLCLNDCISEQFQGTSTARDFKDPERRFIPPTGLPRHWSGSTNHEAADQPRTSFIQTDKARLLFPNGRGLKVGYIR